MTIRPKKSVDDAKRTRSVRIAPALGSANVWQYIGVSTQYIQTHARTQAMPSLTCGSDESSGVMDSSNTGVPGFSAAYPEIVVSLPTNPPWNTNTACSALTGR